MYQEQGTSTSVYQPITRNRRNWRVFWTNHNNNKKKKNYHFSSHCIRSKPCVPFLNMWVIHVAPTSGCLNFKAAARIKHTVRANSSMHFVVTATVHNRAFSKKVKMVKWKQKLRIYKYWINYWHNLFFGITWSYINIQITVISLQRRQTQNTQDVTNSVAKMPIQANQSNFMRRQTDN